MAWWQVVGCSLIDHSISGIHRAHATVMSMADCVMRTTLLVLVGLPPVKMTSVAWLSDFSCISPALQRLAVALESYNRLP